MYSITCKTCSEKATAETYAEANDIFAKHAEHRHEVELINVARTSRTTPANEQSVTAD